MSNDTYQMILDNLHITIEPDEATRRRLENEIEEGERYIKKYCSPDADFTPGTQEGALLCEYVLRAEAGARATFSQDFAEDILQCRLSTETERYAEAMGYAET